MIHSPFVCSIRKLVVTVNSLLKLVPRPGHSPVTNITSSSHPSVTRVLSWHRNGSSINIRLASGICLGFYAGSGAHRGKESSRLCFRSLSHSFHLGKHATSSPAAGTYASSSLLESSSSHAALVRLVSSQSLCTWHLSVFGLILLSSSLLPSHRLRSSPS